MVQFSRRPPYSTRCFLLRPSPSAPRDVFALATVYLHDDGRTAVDTRASGMGPLERGQFFPLPDRANDNVPPGVFVR